MKAILAIAHAEILRNWKLIAVPLTAVLGVFALAAMGTHTTDETFRGNLMGILILFEFALAAVPAAILGLNLFAPDIRQRRLSFYFTRPCAPWQLWIGRLLGAALITSVGWFGGLVVWPLAGGGGMATSVQALVFAALLAGLLLFLNAIVMILAANASRWFIADIVAASAFFAALIWSFRQASQLGDFRQVWDAYALGFGAVCALFFSGLAFLSFGHGDGPSGHRAHSLALWSFGAAAIVGLGAHRAYEWSRPLDSLFIRFARATPAGPAKAVIEASGGSFGASFLLDTQTGNARRISTFFPFSGARDLKSGLRGYVEERFDPVARGFVSHYLVISSSDPDRPPLVDREIPERFRWLRDISDGGTLALFSVVNGFEVIRTDTGATLFQRAASDVSWAVFQDDGTIATMAKEGLVAHLSVLAQDGKVIREQKFPVSPGFWYARLHSDSGRVAITEGPQGVTLYESDGTVVAHLAPEQPLASQSFRGGGRVSPSSVLFTRAGDFVVVGGRGLRLVRHGETAVLDLPLTPGSAPVPAVRGRSIQGQLASGEIVVSESGGFSDAWLSLGEGSILVVDPFTGVVGLRLEKYHPLAWNGFQGVVSASSPSEDSGLRLFQNDEGDIVFLDPGALKPRLLVKSTVKSR